MEKTVDIAVDQGRPSDLLRTNHRAADGLRAVVEMAFRCAEAVGGWKGEADEGLARVWHAVAAQRAANVSGLLATPFYVADRAASMDQLAGFAGSGRRVAFIGSGAWPPAQEGAPGVPFVVHRPADAGLVAPREGFFCLAARTPQQAADLCLIAHRAAEASLCPGVLVVHVGPEDAASGVLQLAELSEAHAYLGLPADEIETPTACQRAVWGARRRRIPDDRAPGPPLQSAALMADVPALARDAMRAFEDLTGRGYDLVERLDTDDADVVLLAAGRPFGWLARHLPALQAQSGCRVGLLHPTLVLPFPGPLVAGILRGKKAVMLVAKGAEAAFLFEALRHSFDRASANGLYHAEGTAAGLPYPDYPVFARREDRPPVYPVYPPDDAFSVEALARRVRQAARHALDAVAPLPARRAPTPRARQAAPPAASGTPSAPQILREEPQEEGTPEKGEASANLREQRLFHRTGVPPEGHPGPDEPRLIPVHLHPYREFSRHRSDYPVCLLERDSAPLAVPLTHLFDDLIARLAGEGEEGERRKHAVLRLEAALRAHVDQGHEGRLSEAWDRAAAALLERDAGKAQKKQVLRDDLRTARAALQDDGPVLACAPATPARLLRTAWRRSLQARGREVREELDALRIRLTDILRVDESKSPEARQPDRLQASVGAAYIEDLDFEALAHLLDETALGDPLPAARRARLRATVGTLEALQPILFPGDRREVPEPDADGEDAASHCAAAMGRMQARLRTLVEFFRAVHVARLEVENRYEDARHDPYFAGYTAAHLAPEERALCPPLVVTLDGDALGQAGTDALVELLSTRLPVKVLVTVDRVCEGPFVGEAACSGWGARLAGMAVALHHAFVLQTTASHVHHLAEGLEAGMRFGGPALFCVYTGSAAHAPRLHPYLRAAVALDARALPAFTYDPEKGSDWAARFRIDANPQHERPWPVSEIHCEHADGSQDTLSVPFTLADFLACDARFARHFLWTPRKKWTPNMVPLADYLRRDAAEANEAIPYLSMAGDDGTRYRVVVTQDVVAATRRAADQWRSLQEWGGIDNSHARRLLDQEKGRLEEEQQRALEAIEKKYQAELDRTTGELAQEIVSNIAAALLNQPVAGPPVAALPPPMSVAVAPPPAPKEKAAQADAAEAADEPADEAPLSLDEPYIETPRCTTCNECTAINPRLFAYDENQQAYIKDLTAGTYREMVTAAEKCPVRIIHPGKPLNPDEPGLDELLKRAEPFL